MLIFHAGSSLHYCLENKLCYDQVGLILYRGACTSKPWSNDACGSVCLLPPTAARGLFRCLDESGSVVDAWDCNGRDCSNDTFKLGPGYLQNTHRLRTELDWDGLPSSATPNIPLPLGVGVGVGLGVLFLAALLALLLVCQRLRAVRKMLRQIQPRLPSFPKQPNPVGMPTNLYESSQRHINQVASSAVCSRSPPGHELPELGDTAELDMRMQ